MNTELTDPIEVEGWADFPRTGLWNLHGDYGVTAKYTNGTTMFINNKNPNGVKFVDAR